MSPKSLQTKDVEFESSEALSDAQPTAIIFQQVAYEKMLHLLGEFPLTPSCETHFTKFTATSCHEGVTSTFPF